MSDVRALPGVIIPGTSEPRADLVKFLRDMLAMAEAGELQSLVGTGFKADGMRLALFSYPDGHNTYEMLGALAWLQHEYVERQT